MSFDYSYGLGGAGMAVFLIVYLVVMLLCGGLGIAMYVLRSLGVYTIAKRRELKHPWMAWVPGLESWLMGSISDQYQYVSKGKVKNKRKWLIGLAIAMAVVYVAFFVLYIVMMVNMVDTGIRGGDVEQAALSYLVGALGIWAVMMVVAIVYAVLYYMAMYDLYRSVDPRNAVMYLVLSILFNVTMPFFVFFNRKKDLGMPPRRPRPQACIPQQPPVAPEPPAETVTEPVAEPAPVESPAEEAPVAEPAPVEVPAEEAPAAEPAATEPIILGAAPESPDLEPFGKPETEKDPWDL